MPLASATEHFVKLQKTVGSQTAVPVCVVHPICVVDGPMVLARGGPEAPDIKLCPWVRIVRQEAPRERHDGFWRHYVVDFVHRGYLPAFIDQHFLPLVQQFADRAISVETILIETKAEVPDLHNWDFKDLRPSTKAGLHRFAADGGPVRS